MVPTMPHDVFCLFSTLEAQEFLPGAWGFALLS